MAEETHCVVLVMRHLTKAMAGRAITAGGGSIGIAGTARSGLVAARNPEDEPRSMLASVKSNLGPKPPSLTYSLKSTELHCASCGRASPRTERTRLLLPARMRSIAGSSRRRSTGCATICAVAQG